MSDTVTLTPTDRAILASYAAMLDGFSAYFGEGYEMVLHSLEHYDRSVIKIVNGYHTGRAEGAPITDLALDMLARMRAQGTAPQAVTYYTHNRKGEPLRSATLPILGEKRRIIGLLCINFYLNTPLGQVLESFMPHANAADHSTETFTDDVDELISNAVNQVRQAVQGDARISASNKNKEIVRQLEAKGIFNLKDGVAKAANMLQISKNTVYLHLRNLK